MGCNIGFGDKYEECGFLLDEYKLFLSQMSVQTYTEKEQKALDLYKEEKKEKIAEILSSLENYLENNLQQKKYKELKETFQRLVEEESKIIYNDGNSQEQEAGGNDIPTNSNTT